MTPETIVKNEVKDWLNIKGWFNFPILQGLGSYKGISDKIAVKDGIVLFIETKSEKGKLTPDEEQFMRDIVEHGGHHIIARGYEDIENYLKAIGMAGWINSVTRHD